MKCRSTNTVVFCLVPLCLFLNGCKEEKKTTASEAKVESPPVVQKESGVPEPVRQTGDFTELVTPVRDRQEIAVPCPRVDQKPVIDGKGTDSVWEAIPEVQTLDYSSQRPIRLKAFHDGQMVYFLVRFPDGAPSETHKTWAWDHDEKVYKPMNDREDACVFKWRLTGDTLSFEPELTGPHTADVWFWKACRTNPSGYLDDKSQIVSAEPHKDALAFDSTRHGTLYLRRVGDEGRSAYAEQTPFEYQGDFVQKYLPREPSGSRADVQGKGVWDDGVWTVELKRKLNTGHDDDVQLVPGQDHRFGLCLYEMAATGVEPNYYQPLYRTGDVFDSLVLSVE